MPGEDGFRAAAGFTQGLELAQSAARLRLSAQAAQQQFDLDRQRLAQEGQRLNIMDQYQKIHLGIQEQSLRERAKLNDYLNQKREEETKRMAAMSSARQAFTQEREAWRAANPNATPEQEQRAFLSSIMAHPEAFGSGGLGSLTPIIEAMERTAPARAPQWVPENKETGEPAHYVDAKGNPVFPPAPKTPTAPETVEQKTADALNTAAERRILEWTKLLPAVKGKQKQEYMDAITAERRGINERLKLTKRGSLVPPEAAPGGAGGTRVLRMWQGGTTPTPQAPTGDVGIIGEGPLSPFVGPTDLSAMQPQAAVLPQAITNAPAVTTSTATGRILPAARWAAGTQIGKGFGDAAEALSALADLPLDTNLRKKVKSLRDDLEQYGKPEFQQQ